jgi:hypothetical protein
VCLAVALSPTTLLITATPLLADRFSKVLVDQGFGVAGPEHEVRLQGVRGWKVGTSKLWLFKDQARRIINVDETSVGTNKTTTRRKNVPVNGNLPKTKRKTTNGGSGHTTMNGAMWFPDYKRGDIPASNAGIFPPQVGCFFVDTCCCVRYFGWFVQSCVCVYVGASACRRR